MKPNTDLGVVGRDDRDLLGLEAGRLDEGPHVRGGHLFFGGWWWWWCYVLSMRMHWGGGEGETVDGGVGVIKYVYACIGGEGKAKRSMDGWIRTNRLLSGPTAQYAWTHKITNEKTTQPDQAHVC